MIQIGNNYYRNLEEQVQKNKEDIAKHWQIDRVLADFGIRIVGTVDSFNDIKNIQGKQYGDAYAVGQTHPYDFYIWTRADIDSNQPQDYWLNIGELAIVGPQGPQGLKGDRGDKGDTGESTKWQSVMGAPTRQTAGKEYDQYLDTNTGNVYQYNNGSWQLKGNIKGPTGSQGPKGERGPQGVRGPQGPIGPQGPTGQTITIVGELYSTDQLPSPYDVPRHYAYLIPNNIGEIKIWVIVGIDNLEWVDAGTLGNKVGVKIDDGVLY